MLIVSKAAARTFLQGVLLTAVSLAASAAEIPLENFAKHPQYKDVKISPNGEYLAVTSIVDDRTVLGLIHLADMQGKNLGAREGSQISDFY
jgi:hypothetical protein